MGIALDVVAAPQRFLLERLEEPWNETTSVLDGTEVASSTPFAGTNRIRFRGSAVYRTLSAVGGAPLSHV